MKTKQKMLKPERMNILFLCGWLCCVAFLIWKAPYSFGNMDEAFYLAVPYRLVQGDALISQEWNLAQLSGILLYPIMWLYMHIFQNFDGIMLNFRYIYIFFQAITALYLYYRLNSKSKACALFASLFLMLYAPFNLMALSYNTMGIMLFATAAVTLATQKTKRI